MTRQLQFAIRLACTYTLKRCRDGRSFVKSQDRGSIASLSGGRGGGRARFFSRTRGAMNPRTTNRNVRSPSDAEFPVSSTLCDVSRAIARVIAKRDVEDTRTHVRRGLVIHVRRSIAIERLSSAARRLPRWCTGRKLVAASVHLATAPPRVRIIERSLKSFNLRVEQPAAAGCR